LSYARTEKYYSFNADFLLADVKLENDFFSIFFNVNTSSLFLKFDAIFF